MLRARGLNAVCNAVTGGERVYLLRRDAKALLRRLQTLRSDAELFAAVTEPPTWYTSKECCALRTMLRLRLPRAGLRPELAGTLAPLREALGLERFGPAPLWFGLCRAAAQAAALLLLTLALTLVLPTAVSLYFLLSGAPPQQAKETLAQLLHHWVLLQLNRHQQTLSALEPDNRFSLTDFLVLSPSQLLVRPARFQAASSSGTVTLFPTFHTAQPELFLELLSRCQGGTVVLLEAIGWGLVLGTQPSFPAALEEPPTEAIEALRQPSVWSPATRWLGLMRQAWLQSYVLAGGRRTAKREAKARRRPGPPAPQPAAPSPPLFVNADLKYPSPATALASKRLTERSSLALSHVTDPSARYLVPWGLAHVPFMATQLMAKGLQPEWEAPVLVFDFEREADHFLRLSPLWRWRWRTTGGQRQ
eukprot:EG_transcript_11670